MKKRFRIFGIPLGSFCETDRGTCRKIRILGIPFTFRTRRLEERLEALEKKLIRESGLWDPLWYVKTYGYDMTRSEALDHWYRTGWLKGEKPSARLDADCYPPEDCCGRNPILAHLLGDRMFFTAGSNTLKRSDDASRVESYLSGRAARKAKGVVYTCVTGGYDDIREIAAPGFVAADWDYVCFTDDAALVAEGRVGVWEMRPLAFAELDGTRNNRWHKTHPHTLFPEYAESVYIDANINVRTRYLFDAIRRLNRSFVLPRHFEGLCVYREYRNVLEQGIDDAERVTRERELLEKSGMPRNYGLGENNVLYRRHGEPEVAALDEEWWSLVRDYSKRDQLSLMWLFWKRGWKLEEMSFENARLLPDDFLVFAHKGTPRCKY